MIRLAMNVGMPSMARRAATNELETSRAIASAALLEHGPNPSLINLNRHRSLQKCYGQHKPLMSSEAQQDSLYAAKRPMLDSHSMSNLHKRPRLSGQSRPNSRLQGSNFGFINSDRSSANSDYVDNPGDAKNWKPV
jgi:hypothetical protein